MVTFDSQSLHVALQSTDGVLVSILASSTFVHLCVLLVEYHALMVPELGIHIGVHLLALFKGTLANALLFLDGHLIHVVMVQL